MGILVSVKSELANAQHNIHILAHSDCAVHLIVTDLFLRLVLLLVLLVLFQCGCFYLHSLQAPAVAQAVPAACAVLPVFNLIVQNVTTSQTDLPKGNEGLWNHFMQSIIFRTDK